MPAPPQRHESGVPPEDSIPSRTYEERGITVTTDPDEMAEARERFGIVRNVDEALRIEEREK